MPDLPGVEPYFEAVRSGRAARLRRVPLLSMGAKEYLPITNQGDSGFVTASVVDPFGNVLGIMYNPHYLEILGATPKA